MPSVCVHIILIQVLILSLLTFWLTFIYCCMCVCAGFHVNTCTGQKKNCGRQFYPSIMWGPKGIIKLWSSDMAESTFNCWNTLLALRSPPTPCPCFCLSLFPSFYVFILMIWIIFKSFFENSIYVYNASWLYSLWLHLQLSVCSHNTSFSLLHALSSIPHWIQLVLPEWA